MMINSTPTLPVECDIVLDSMWDKALDRLKDFVHKHCRSRQYYEVTVSYRFMGNELLGWSKPTVTEWEPWSQREKLAGL